MASLIPNLGTPSADASGAMRNYLMASQALSQAYQAPIDIINKLNAENALAKKEAKQEARQAVLDAQNKQLFDLKMSEVDRANKDREALINFNKKMLEPQVISGIITDSVSASQVDKMSFTPEELAEYNLAKGDLSKLTGSTKAKAEMQMALSNFSDKVSVSPEYQETGYQQAQRIASGMELTPSVLEELKKYQVADVTAEKERKKDMSTYSAEAKELETKIAELRTKQSAIQDKAAGVGKEWGKKGTSSGGSEVLDSAKLLKYTDMVKDTDSADELQGMIKEVFVNPNIPEKQKEAIAANIVLSSGAKLPQGLIDFGKLNVSVEDAQKATEEYLTGLKTGKFTPNTPKEIGGINDEIALLEARKNAALAKANAYSLDRTEAAKSAIGSRIDELLGKTSAPVSTGDKSIPLTIRTNNPGAVKNASRTDKNAMWEGQTGFDEQGHAVFSSPEYGARAMAKNLQIQIEKGNTLTSLLKEYATGNQDAYIKNVSAKTGIDPNAKLKESDIRQIMGAMVEHEAGVDNPFSKEVLDKGYELALGKPKTTIKEPDVKELFANVKTAKEPDVKELFANVKTAKERESATNEINKLAEIYKGLGGTGGSKGSAGPIDDLTIAKEAEKLSKTIKVPTSEIIETIKSQVRQEALTNDRNRIINQRMFDTNMAKLLTNDPKVQEEYTKAWREEARKRGYIGTSVRPFSIEEFIQKTYPEKLQYK